MWSIFSNGSIHVGCQSYRLSSPLMMSSYTISLKKSCEHQFNKTSNVESTALLPFASIPEA